ncbi:MAG: DUF5060 domain-containing protein, partial [Planctomycetota bacterium]
MLLRTVSILSAAGLVFVAFSCRIQQQAKVHIAHGGDLEVEYSQSTKTVPKFEVFEITFKHNQEYKNPFLDVTIDVTFTSPSNKPVKVGGFHYGSSTPATITTKMIKTEKGERKQVLYNYDKRDLWKARFAPSEVGQWKYSFVFKNSDGHQASGEGAFACVTGRRPNPGFIRRHPTNPFRFVFDDGSAYFPIGLQDCWGDNSATGSALDQCSMEGPFRTDRRDAPELPAGPMFVRGPSCNPQNADVYFRHFSQCGFNMYRFSQENCSYSLNRDLDEYLVQEGIMTDELLQRGRAYGFGIFYGIFGFQKCFNNEPDDEEKMSKVRRFIKYNVDRWGAYVDFWEFLNEQKADDRWYEIMIAYL